MKEKTLQRDLRLIIVRDNEELFFSHSLFCEKCLNSSIEAPQQLCHMDVDAEQLLHLPSFLRTKLEYWGARACCTMMLTALFASKCFVLSNWWGCETVWWPTYIWQMCFSPRWREEHRGKKSARENRRGEEKANKRTCETNSQREDLQSQLCQTEDEVKEKQPIKHLATCPFNAGALCSFGAIQGEYVFCLKWLLGRKLKSSEEQLSTDPTYCLLKTY